MQVTIPNEILIGEVGILLAEGKEVVLMTKGWSMNPFIIGDRDSVLLKKTEKLEPGDIVLAEVHPQKYVLHRIIALEGERVTLMGDGNITGQEHCTRNNILGTVQKIIHPDGKTIVPGKAAVWRKTGPQSRRIVLAFYRRTVLRLAMRRKPKVTEQ